MFPTIRLVCPEEHLLADGPGAAKESGPRWPNQQQGGWRQGPGWNGGCSGNGSQFLALSPLLQHTSPAITSSWHSRTQQGFGTSVVHLLTLQMSPLKRALGA